VASGIEDDKESPVAGLGPGGYQRNLDNVRYRYAEDPKYRFVDIACNHYLQMAVELGIPGLALNLVITVYHCGCFFALETASKIGTSDGRSVLHSQASSFCLLFS